MEKKLIAFLDKYGLDGEWGGGNDSGGIDSLETETPIDGESLLEEVSSLIYERVFEPEYGGWAWNFSASGTISYDREKKEIVIEGSQTDYDEGEWYKTISLDIKQFFTPEELPRIDSVNIMVSEGESPSVRINIKNGVWTDRFDQIEDEIVKALEKELDIDSNNELQYYVDEAIDINKGEVLEVSVYEIVSEEKRWTINLKEEEDES